MGTAPDPCLDLEALMSLYQQGDVDGARALIASVNPRLFRYLVSQSFSRAHAEDLVQDIWLQIHLARHTHRKGEPVLPWIYAIARHVQVDAYRRQRRSREQGFATVPEPAAVRRTGDLPLESFERLVAPLPKAQREVVTMLKVAGMSCEEVARATSSTVGAVKLKAHRAYERLRKLLASPAELRRD